MFVAFSWPIQLTNLIRGIASTSQTARNHNSVCGLRTNEWLTQNVSLCELAFSRPFVRTSNYIILSNKLWFPESGSNQGSWPWSCFFFPVCVSMSLVCHNDMRLWWLEYEPKEGQKMLLWLTLADCLKFTRISQAIRCGGDSAHDPHVRWWWGDEEGPTIQPTPPTTTSCCV